MQDGSRAIVYLYRRNKINEDDDYLTYTYDLVGVSLGNEIEDEFSRYLFVPEAGDKNEIVAPQYACINDPNSLDYEYVYAFPHYVAGIEDDDLRELLEKSEEEAKSIADYVLCQIHTRGTEVISTHYVDPENFETLTDIDTNSVDGIISMISNKHDKVNQVKTMLKEIQEKRFGIVPEPTIIYADDIYDFTSRSVICQDEQIKAIAASIAKNQRIRDPRLKDNLLICGPTGVGKSEIFRCISKELGIPVTFEDSTEYTAAGYVGKSVSDMLYNLFLSADGNVRKAERGIIIVDEIDKKISGDGQHDVYTKAVLDSLLKMAEGHKYHVETKNCQFDIDTSFITFAMMGAFSGIEELNEKKRTLGFVSSEEAAEAEKTVNCYTDQTLMKYGLKPEFLGRNKLIVMNALDVPDFCRIITESDKSVLLLYKYLFDEIGIKLIYDQACIETIAKKAKELGVGARSIKKIIEKAFEVINYQAFSKNHYSELIISPETFEDNTQFILR